MIRVYVGPMFAGKTSALINEITRNRIARKKVIIFKPEIDTRYSESHIVTHLGEQIECIRSSNLIHIVEEKYEQKPDVIVFDEIQFYDRDIVSLVQTYSKDNIQVICGGLDMDYFGIPFHTSALLMGVADEVVKLKAVCVQCGADAGMTYHTQPHVHNIDIGGNEKYQARCIKCWQN